MKTEKELKKLVKEKYGKIALQSKVENESSCCKSTNCCDTADYVNVADSYENLSGYNPDADLGLGCGLPTEFAQIKKGDTVVDLGSGAGNDCFVARAIAGETGKIIGIDMTETMVKQAQKNANKLGYDNVEFILGEIENMPIKNNTADVVVSNCVLNLIPNKNKALSETYRIMKKGGHFSISDIVLEGKLPVGLQEDAAMYAGCISGAMQKEEYLNVIQKTGFKNIKVQKEKTINLPKEILSKYLSESTIKEFEESGTGIASITVYAEK